MVHVLRLEVNAAVGTEKMATAGMIAGKARLVDPLIETFPRDGCGAINSVDGAEDVDVDPLMSAMRAWFATGDFPNHQRVAGAIEYIANSDRKEVEQHPVALIGVTLKDV